jgi:iron(III) transport system substrate-binding protein
MGEMRKGPTRVHLLACAALALVLGACGGSSDDGDARRSYEHVLAAVEGLNGKERSARLLELAKQDGGELSLYTSASASIADGLVEAFQESSGLDVALYRANTEAVTARLVEEARADFHGADVAELDGVAMYNLAGESLLVPYRPRGIGALSAGAARDGWTVVEHVTFVVGWNTKRVPEDERPRSWEDLADPKWEGRLAMEFGDFEWYGTLHDYWVEEKGKTEAEADRLFAAMGRNARVVTGHTFMAELLAGGEFDVAASAFASTIDRLQKEGAPVSWHPSVEPVVGRVNGAGLVLDAPNPAAAVLYLDWIVGEGQAVLAELGREPARKDLLQQRNAKKINVDYSQLVERQDEWTSEYERVLSKAAPGPEES